LTAFNFNADGRYETAWRWDRRRRVEAEPVHAGPCARVLDFQQRSTTTFRPPSLASERLRRYHTELQPQRTRTVADCFFGDRGTADGPKDIDDVHMERDLGQAGVGLWPSTSRSFGLTARFCSRAAASRSRRNCSPQRIGGQPDDGDRPRGVQDARMTSASCIC